MMMAAEEGFSLGSMNDFFDESDEGFDVSIDAESFFTILNEENDNSHPLPVGFFLVFFFFLLKFEQFSWFSISGSSSR